MEEPRDKPSTGRRYGGQTPSQRADARRDRLLEAALELFGTKGVANTQIAALCGAAGISPRDFYKSFPTRPALMAALYDRLIADVASQVQRAVDGAPPSLEAKVRAGAKAFLGAYLDDPRVGRVVCLEVASAEKELGGRPRKAMHLFVDLARTELTSLRGKSRAPAGVSSLRLLAMTGAINELVIETLTSPKPPSRRRLESEVTELILLFVGHIERSDP
ncbi:MAG: TetR/AcrR family transcriptional regulator [Myxococcota bacterium]